jgi:hypothetical protein
LQHPPDRTPRERVEEELSRIASWALSARQRVQDTLYPLDEAKRDHIAQEARFISALASGVAVRVAALEVPRDG